MHEFLLSYRLRSTPYLRRLTKMFPKATKSFQVPFSAMNEEEINCSRISNNVLIIVAGYGVLTI